MPHRLTIRRRPCWQKRPGACCRRPGCTFARARQGAKLRWLQISPRALTRGARSNGDRRLDRGMRLVALEREVLVLEFQQFAARGVEAHAREGTGRTVDLLARLLEVIQVEMCVAEREDELARLKIRNLRHHQREERVRGDVEGHTEEEVGAALVHLAGEAAFGDVALEE